MRERGARPGAFEPAHAGSDLRGDEAIVLRAEWHHLMEEQARLQAAGAELVDSTDAAALRQHAQRLHDHNQRQQAWKIAAESFHERHGPIGDLLE